MKVTLDLPDELVRRAEELAERRGQTLNEFVVDALWRDFAEAPGSLVPTNA